MVHRSTNNLSGSGEKAFYLRAVKAGDYVLGENGNNFWSTYISLSRRNYRGIDWKVSSTNEPGSLTIEVLRKNYTPYIMKSTFIQPVLYGEYNVATVAGYN